MFDAAMIEFLHTGCALLVGTVDQTGAPHAARAHGLTVVDAEAGRVRLLVDAEDEVTIDNLQPGALVAITAASVATFHSVQLKGRVVAVDQATAADEAKRVQYSTDFINDIHEFDFTPLEPLERWIDRSVVPCLVDIDSSFDQTPGPSAGSALSSGEQ